MKTRAEKIMEKSEEVFKNLYCQGLSINDISEVANNLHSIGEKAIDNPKNTIGAISNGALII